MLLVTKLYNPKQIVVKSASLISILTSKKHSSLHAGACNAILVVDVCYISIITDMNHHAVNLRSGVLKQPQHPSSGFPIRERTFSQQHACYDDSDHPSNATVLPKSPLYRPLQLNDCCSNDRPNAYPHRRRVTFASRIRIKEVQHWAEMPTEILEAMWIIPQEYTVIKDILKQTVRL